MCLRVCAWACLREGTEFTLTSAHLQEMSWKIRKKSEKTRLFMQNKGSQRKIHEMSVT